MKISELSLFRRLFAFRRIKRSFGSPRYLLKWLLLSTLIGLVAGGGAIAFFAAIGLTTHFLLGQLVGYLPPEPAGEGGMGPMPFWNAARPWLLPVITTAGGLVAGIIVFSLAPEAEGHGTDAAIGAFHQGKSIRARIPLIKLVASAITIGSGGSAGREGPSAQISAGFGSLLADVLHLNIQDRRIALATGIGAGIGAIFRAPLGGAILAAEILYKEDLEVEAIIPALIASIVGYSVFGSWSGWNPIFTPPDNIAFSFPPQLLYYVVLGLLCGGVGLLYARGFYGITHLFHRLPLPRWIKPGIGGLLVGLIGLVLPQALGMGYGWVQVSMGRGLLSIPLWVVLLLPFAKIVTTGFSIGSGGSGGIFGPGMVIGGMLGAAVWRLTYHVLPGVPATPGPFVIVGMMALFGGIAHAPLAVMLMVAEMTGNLSMLAPAMIAVGIASILVGKQTIYTSQVDTRADSPAHRLHQAIPLLSTLTARQALVPPVLVLSPEQRVASAERLLAEQTIRSAPVGDQRGILRGILSQRDIQQTTLAERENTVVADLMTTQMVLAHPDETLDDVLERLSNSRRSWLPVVDDGGKLLGTLSVADMMRTYRLTLTRNLRRTRGFVKGTAQVEIEMTPRMPLVGRALDESHLPAGCLVVSLRRAGAFLFPQGSTVVQAGDLVTFLVSPQGEEALQRYLAAGDSSVSSPAVAHEDELLLSHAEE
jgi:CIC family chloride channel protein